MPVPDFETLLLPLLRMAGDGQEHTFAEVVQRLGEEFGLSEAERMELNPSGAPRLRNRTGWAKTYLKKAGLLEDSARGRFRITSSGRELLASSPPPLDTRYLEDHFPALRQFRKRRARADGPEAAVEPADTGHRALTAEEALDSSYREVREALADELLERVKSCSPAFFEKLVVDLLVAMGYGGSRRDAGQAVGQSGDGGIDGIIKEDRLGLDVVYIQAKRWEATVGRPVVQAFAGSLEGHHARKGVLLTTSQFSAEARDYVSRIEKKIVLIDGPELAHLMIDCNVGVADVAVYQVQKVDLDYFGESD